MDLGHAMYFSSNNDTYTYLADTALQEKPRRIARKRAEQSNHCKPQQTKDQHVLHDIMWTLPVSSELLQQLQSKSSLRKGVRREYDLN